MILARL